MAVGNVNSPTSTSAVIEELFDRLPDTVFFLKDTAGRYFAVNRTLVARCGLRDKGELLGRRVSDIFPNELSERYARQDADVLRRGTRIIDRLELHWHERRRSGWCLTTKLPLRDAEGTIVGLAGISRDIRPPGDRGEAIPAGLAAALEHLECHYDEPISPASLARHAGIPPVRFARLIKRIFRLSPHQMITQTRLAAAARLLAETDRTVADIALASGFYDHSAFSRAFRSATHSTPSEFRASHSRPETLKRQSRHPGLLI